MFYVMVMTLTPITTVRSAHMAVDRKYGKVTLQYGAVPKDEPVFVLRGQDAHALDTLRFYLNTCIMMGASADHLTFVKESISKIESWSP
jgi:hypothetical protein